MSWFKKDPEPPPLAQPTGEIGLLGSHSRFKGTVRFKGTLTLDGAVTGNIMSPEGSGTILIVNQQAEVQGDVVADAVLISGRVVGKISARERVEVFHTGVLLGDVVTGDLMVEGGGEFQGACRMLRPAPPLPQGNGNDQAASGGAPWRAATDRPRQEAV